MLTLVIVIIFLALLFDFLNGMNDAANSIATVVSTGVLSPRFAVLWAAFFNFIAAFGFGVHVANTIGKGIIDVNVVDLYLILAALTGAIIWTEFCTRIGMPISVSHALIGGLVGAGIAKGGFDVLVMSGIYRVTLFIFLSPLLGLLFAYLIMVAVTWLARKMPPSKVDNFFRIGQLISSAAFSLGHGTNDAQKTMGIIALVLFTAGYLGPTFYVPTWVILSAHAANRVGNVSRRLESCADARHEADAPSSHRRLLRGRRCRVNVALHSGQRNSGQHDAHHRRRDHGRGRDTTALRRALGSRG